MVKSKWKEQQDKRKKLGRCIQCAKPVKGNSFRCREHADRHNKVEANRKRKKKRLGICENCTKPSSPKSIRCKECRNRHNKRIKKWNNKRKREFLFAYGGKCACCGISELEFLTIDHIKGGGNKHRRALGGDDPKRLYSWIKKNKYPAGFQVLCFNCNFSKHIGGVCVHKRSK